MALRIQHVRSKCDILVWAACVASCVRSYLSPFFFRKVFATLKFLRGISLHFRVLVGDHASASLAITQPSKSALLPLKCAAIATKTSANAAHCRKHQVSTFAKWSSGPASGSGNAAAGGADAPRRKGPELAGRSSFTESCRQARKELIHAIPSLISCRYLAWTRSAAVACFNENLEST